jgi:tRNA/rRNA methyltransferase
MPGAGTDKTRNWIETPAPVVVLVEPQLGENIGSAARVMANFGLSKLRIVNPKQGWPNEKARVLAAGADRVLDQAQIYDTMADAVADCTYVLVTTARAHGQAKPVLSPEGAARELMPRVNGGATAALVFGRERIGLMNTEVAQADAIVTLPINPAFASLNLAQAVAVVCYEWLKVSTGDALPYAMPQKSPPAAKQQLAAFLDNLERELDRIEFFRPAEKRDTMLINLRNIFSRTQLTQQDVQTLSGVVTALVEGRKGSARGGIFDSEQAADLRAMIAQHSRVQVLSDQNPARGLARLLRRNPTEAERTLWETLTRDRRFAGLGFKRQTPIGGYVVDFVSFPLRAVIDLVPENESGEGAAARAKKRAWLSARSYRVLEVEAGDIGSDVASVLERLAGALAARGKAISPP